MAWEEQAVCRTAPEQWFNRSTRAVATHICRTHCPVVEQCLRAALERPPLDGVQGGVAFNIHSKPFPEWYWKPAASCPTCEVEAPKSSPKNVSGCGTFAGYRRHLRHREPACLACRSAAAVRGQQLRAGAVA